MKKTEHAGCTDCQETVHPDHTREIGRLNRISGQIDGVKRMIEERRYCPDILIQLSAIRAAVKSVEADILKVHLGSCVANAFQSENGAEKKQKILELVDLFKRYD